MGSEPRCLRFRLTIRGVTPDADLTGLLQAWSRGDANALEQLAPLVQRELREMARRMLARERRAATGSQPIRARVVFAAARLARHPLAEPGHFFSTTARMMRRALVDMARTRRAAKRGMGLVSCRWTQTFPRLDLRSMSLLSMRRSSDSRRWTRDRVRWSSSDSLADSVSRRPPRRWASRAHRHQ